MRIARSVTPANVNDITAATAMPIEPGATYVYDIGYCDYRWWAQIDEVRSRFVTRLKKNTPFRWCDTTVFARQVIFSATALSFCRSGSPAVERPAQVAVREIQVMSM
jgi:Transposase DDE domain